MDLVKDITEILMNFATALGIVLGGLWTYRLFIKQRLGLPKLKIDFEVNEILLHENTKLLHVELKLTNTSTVIVELEYAELRICQIVPIPTELIPILKSGADIVSKEKAEYDWPLLREREWKWEKGKIEIEPGENDSLHADFAITSNIETVQLYFYVANSSKNKSIGWTLTKIYESKIR